MSGEGGSQWTDASEGGRKEGRRDNRKGWDERQGGVEEGSDRKDLLLLVCFTS